MIIGYPGIQVPTNGFLTEEKWFDPNQKHFEGFPQTVVKEDTRGRTCRVGRLCIIMSDLDVLIVTFRTQLSKVMEAVVKSAMFEVTRLVEEVFMMEVKRSKQEVDSLRLQLQWTGSKHGEDAENPESSVEFARNEADQSPGALEARADEQQECKKKKKKKTA